MSASSLFGTQLPIGKSLFLAWIVLAFLSMQSGIVPELENVSPSELALYAALLFGYFTFFTAMIRLGLGAFIFIPFLLLMWILGGDLRRLDRSLRKKNEETDPNKFEWGPKLSRLIDVLALFAAVYFFSESLFHQLAIIGLALVIAFYIVGYYETDN